MDSQLKDSATQVAKEQGFSSLQEVVRLFLEKLARGELRIEFVAVQKEKAPQKK